MTPNFAYVHVCNPYWRGIGLWIPVFLLWIPGLILAPIILPVMLVVCLLGRIDPSRAMATFWSILCALPGTTVHVSTAQNQVDVRIL